jgi:hypothetical protein
MAGKHIHVHLHRTADAGTSEGAKKAAQTRGHGGGFQPRTPGGFGGASAARSHPEGFVQGVGPVHNKPKPDPEPFRGYDKSVKDAGTSEGAKKAAQTRKAHGGGATPFDASKHQNMAAAHYEHAKTHGNIGGSRTNSAHYGASRLHSEASRLHTQAARTTRPEHVEAAMAATRKANAASKRLGHPTYGTA